MAKSREEKTKVGRILYDIAKFIKGLPKHVKVIAPIAIKIVEYLKNVNIDPRTDAILGIINHLIPGKKDDELVSKLRKVVDENAWKVLEELIWVEGNANIENEWERRQAILDKLKTMTKDARKIVLHGIASFIIEKASDGKITWSEAIEIAEKYYQDMILKGAKEDVDLDDLDDDLDEDLDDNEESNQ